MGQSRREYLEEMWAPGTIVYMPGTYYDGLVRNAYTPHWMEVSEINWVDGQSASGMSGWLNIEFKCGFESSPYWIRRADALLPGDIGYVGIPDGYNTERFVNKTEVT